MPEVAAVNGYSLLAGEVLDIERRIGMARDAEIRFASWVELVIRIAAFMLKCFRDRDREVAHGISARILSRKAGMTSERRDSESAFIQFFGSCSACFMASASFSPNTPGARPHLAFMRCRNSSLVMGGT